MKAVVKLKKPGTEIYAAEVDDSGEFVVFESLGCPEPEIDDVLSIHELCGLGRETFKNITLKGGAMMDVFVEDYCSWEILDWSR